MTVKHHAEAVRAVRNLRIICGVRLNENSATEVIHRHIVAAIKDDRRQIDEALSRALNTKPWGGR